ncbi:MAG: hypothetical protein AB7H93_03955 [Vicinamibacterales bacterium]
MRSVVWIVLLCGLAAAPRPASAQYAEQPVPLPVPSSAAFSGPGRFTAAAQIGRRLFVAGPFTRLSPPTGSAVVVDLAGQYVPGAFPYFSGDVRQIVPDGVGGWLVAGEFVSVNGLPIAGFARVAPNRTVDARYRVVANGAIRKVAIAHGRIYLAGDFTSVNGASRRGLAALDAVSGALSPWGAGFDGGGLIRELSFSSLAVYVAGGGDPGHVWGLDAGSGRVLFDRPGFVSALAASSARVYLGGVGSTRPVWAIDPFTGRDTPWTPGFGFQYLPATYGWDATQITALLLDEGRLYIGGRFRTTDGRSTLAAVDAGSGQPSNWRPLTPDPYEGLGATLARVGPAITASLGGTLQAFDVASAATVPFAPDVVGAVATAALAPEGVVIGGTFNGSGGVNRAGLAAIDLDTYTTDPWTSAATAGPGDPFLELATDGTWLFARTEGTLNGFDARLLKIDPTTGAVVAERTFPSITTRMRVAGPEIVVTTYPRNTSTGAVGVVTIADWSYTALPVPIGGGWVTGLDVAGDTIYVAGAFTSVGGQTRPSFAAVHRQTGAVLPWNPRANTPRGLVRTSGGRVWAAGDFTRIGGQRRRGLAELDPVSGAALPWNPDIPGVLFGDTTYPGIAALEIGPDGLLYASIAPGFYSAGITRAVVSGQITPGLVVFSPATGRRLPWRPSASAMTSVQPDCFLAVEGCLPRAISAPADLQVTQSGATVSFTWALPAAPSRTGVRLEVGTVAGQANLISVDLPADQQAFSSAAPPGRYFARVRALAGLATSHTTPDVSFAVGPPAVPASPLDFRAVTDGANVTFTWQPPSTGAPPQYELQVGSREGSRDLAAIPLPGAATSWTVTAPVSTYWTRLAAVNAAGRSAPSNEVFLDLWPRQSSCSTVAPINLTATVVNRVVTFAWAYPPDASDEPPRLVAGSAPGLSDLASIQVTPYATSFSVAAPPGTYYVRLVVGCFTTGSSNEVQVVVP